MSEEQKQKLSNALSGRSVSDEQKEQISKALKEKYNNGYINPQKGKTKYPTKEYRCVWCSKIFYRHCSPEKEDKIKCCSRECQIKWRSSVGGKNSKKNDANNWSEIVKKAWETRHALAKR